MSVDIATALLAKLTGQDIPRDEPRVRVRIQTFADGLVTCGVRLPIPEKAPSKAVGQHLIARTVEAEFYEGDLADLEALVETNLSPAHVERVETDLAADLAEHIATSSAGRKDREQAEKVALASFPGSFPGYFRRAFKRDLRPFLSVELVGEGESKGKKKAA